MQNNLKVNKTKGPNHGKKQNNRKVEKNKIRNVDKFIYRKDAK